MNRSLALLAIGALCTLALMLRAADEQNDAGKDPIKPPVATVVRGGAGLGAAQINPANFLRNPKIQERLKLTDEQKTKIEEVQKEVQAARQGIYKELQGVAQGAPAAKLAEITKKVQQAQAKGQKKLDGILTEKQREQLADIGVKFAVQRQGAQACASPAVAKRLQISGEQQEKISAAQKEMREKQQQLAQDVRNGAVDRTTVRGKRQEIRDEADKKIRGVLTNKQKEELKKLEEDTIDFGRAAFGIRRGVRVQPLPIRPGALPRRIQIQPRQLQPKQAEPKNADKQE